ncbi:insulin-degrading enzyme [Galendromus occidentalis]|uniref:Insulin-degrading enzyme n=1 Tax=Galendromus occidentalis TaxID=34638 RepID=A0AAJ7SGA7_9ACAR|nr:insulin-degrading enzyme [Galendromus occidentalis]
MVTNSRAVVLVLLSAALLVFILILCFHRPDYEVYVVSSEEITKKPVVDNASYISLRLRNDMDVIIASDPSLEDAEVALCVKVGSWSDPVELQGLAHFTEHVLFLGNKKYPGHGDFISHIQSNGGTLNARTGKERTCYFFSIDPDHLGTAMDMFGWMMKEPLIKSETVMSELQNVDSEYKRLMNQDGRRVEAVDSETSDPDHPQRMFDCGSSHNMMQGVEILKSPLHVEMRKFYDRYYSSNSMALGVRGPFDTETLKRLAIKNFHDVKNTRIRKDPWPSPYRNTSGKEILVMAVRDVDDLYIRFSLSNVTTASQTAFLKMILRSEHSGGLVKKIKDHLWISTLSIYDENYAGSTTMSIEFHLTKEGLKNRNKIVEITFAYLNFLRSRTREEFQLVFSDLRAVEELEFKFFSTKELRKTRRDYVYILDLVENRMTYDIDHVISGSRLLGDFQYENLLYILSQLKPENCRVLAVSQSFANETDKVEKYYHAQYKVRDILPQTMRLWSAAQDQFSLPQKNPLVPREARVVDIDPAYSEKPVLIANRSLSRLWLLQTDFGVPKADVTVYWKSSIDGPDSKAGIIAELILRAFQRSLSDKLYMAKDSGINVRSSLKAKSSFGNYGSLMFSFNAYSSVLPGVIKLVFRHFNDFTLDVKTLGVIKDFYRISLADSELYSTVEHGNIQERLLLKSNLTTKKLKIQLLDTINLEDVRSLLTTVREPRLVKVFVSGNIRRETAEEMFDVIAPRSSKDVYQASCEDLPRKYQLPPGSIFYYVGYDENQSQRSVTTYHEIGPSSVDNEVVLRELLVHIASPEAFNVLRTKEQLGYGAGVISTQDSRSHGLMTYVETKNDTQYVTDRVFNFMKVYLKDYIRGMTRAQFNQHRSAVLLKKLHKPIKRVERLGAELLDCNCDYTREKRYAEILSQLTVDDVAEFHQKYVVDNRSSKVIVTVIEKEDGTAQIGRGLPSQPEEVYTNIADFQKELQLLPAIGNTCR